MDRPLDTERRIVTAPDGRKIDVLTAGPAAGQADAHLSLTVSSLGRTLDDLLDLAGQKS
jgi:hypothetical protein